MAKIVCCDVCRQEITSVAQYTVIYKHGAQADLCRIECLRDWVIERATKEIKGEDIR